MPTINIWIDQETNKKLVGLQRPNETKQDAATRILMEAIDKAHK